MIPRLCRRLRLFLFGAHDDDVDVTRQKKPQRLRPLKMMTVDDETLVLFTVANVLYNETATINTLR